MIRLSALLVLAVTLAACSALLNFTPERAAVQEALRSGGSPDFQVNPNSVQVVQTQPRGEEMLVMVRFEGTRSNSQQDECLFLYEMSRSPLGWSQQGGGGGCGPLGGMGQPLEVGAGAHSGTDHQALSYASGLVWDERIVTVEVTWDDGEVSRVPVLNGSYLAFRDGLQDMTEVRGLDDQDQVVFTSESPVIAPGKEEPFR